MKNYIFFIPSICNIGGAQLYLVNKMQYLREKGWNVNVIYARKDVILIEKLKEFQNNAFPLLDYSTLYYSKKTIIKTANEICRCLNLKKNDYTVIESSTASMATWGEYVASILNCKHLAFDFEEVFALSPTQLDFYYFKHRRHELAGITDKSVPLMFKGSNYNIINPENYRACPIPTIQDIDNNNDYNLSDYDCVIGSLGRLNKGFVYPALIEILKYVESKPEKKIAVLLIGDTKDKIFKDKVKSMFKNKADLYITGEMWPVPLNLVKQVDVFVSSSGAAKSTAIEDIPTISVSPETFLPNGILNYTTKNAIFEREPAKESISELIEYIVEEGYCINHDNLHMFDNYWEKVREEHYSEFKRQESIALEEKATEYFDILSLKSFGIRKYVASYAKLVGANNFLKTIKFLHKHIGTLIHG